MPEEMNMENMEQQNAAEDTGDTGKETVKTFTQDEVNKIVEKRLNRERQKLAGMLGPADPREQALREREQAITEKELRSFVSETFKNENLPVDVLELINYTDKESCEKSIELVRKVYTANVQDAVEARLRGGKPIKKAPPSASIDAQLRGAFGFR